MITILLDIHYRDVLFLVCHGDTAEFRHFHFENAIAPITIDKSSLLWRLLRDDAEAQSHERGLDAMEPAAGR